MFLTLAKDPNFGLTLERMASANQQASFKPTLSLLLRWSWRDCWDHLGLILIISLIHNLCLPLFFSLFLGLRRLHIPHMGYLALLILGLLLIPALYTGYASIAYRICLGKTPSIALFFQSMRKLYGVALRLGTLQLLLTGGLLANILFYAHIHNPFRDILTLFWSYLLFAWILISLYQYPLLVLQENGIFDEPNRPAKRGALAVVRRSFFLTLGNPLYTFGLFLLTSLLSLLCLITGVGWILLYPALPLQITFRATYLLLARYAIVPPPPSLDTPPSNATE